MIKDTIAFTRMFFTQWVPQLLNTSLGIFDQIPMLYKIIGLIAASFGILKYVINKLSD